METEPLLLTKKDMALKLGHSERTIMRLADRGTIPQPIDLTKKPQWHRQSVELWLAAKSEEVKR